MTTLVFSLGPVQGFISQSRRTADGWVGSYLLSYLVCRAALALEKHGEIVEPYPENIPLYKALKRDPDPPLTSDGDLTIAGLPNNILVELHDGVDPLTAGQEAASAVVGDPAGEITGAWQKIAASVLEALRADMKIDKAFQETWRRQTSALWETYWAWGVDSTAAVRALAARKGLRDFPAVEELGDRCTLCAEREALRDGTQRAEEKTARDATVRFWREFAESQKPEGLIKPGGKERLCAPCLIKRLIPWGTNEIRTLWGAGDVVFPSTSTMATVLTKAALVTRAYQEGDGVMRAAIEQFTRTLSPYGRADPVEAFPAWEEALKDLPDDVRTTAKTFVRLDGDWLLYGEGVKNDLDLSPDTHRTIEGAHRALLNAMKKAEVDVPPIYWALLTMDGDRMGKLKETFPSEGLEISKEINAFAQSVRLVVQKHNGRLVYAGGDDVLAFFPVETALPAAEALRLAFQKQFADWLEKKPDRGAILNKAGVQPPTLSGSIVYAHHQAPLGALIHRGHVLLKQEAKGRAGRNALAVEVRGRAGARLTFAARWVDDAGSALVKRIDAVVHLLKNKEVASGFLYSLRENAELLGMQGPFTNAGQREGYIASLAKKTRLTTAETGIDVAQKVLALCGEPGPECLATDPLIFARFLHTGGREER